MSKGYIIFSSILIILVTVFFFMWRNTSNELDNAKTELQNAQLTINVLQSDNDKLVKYNLERDKKIKEIEAKYSEISKNIPTDNCGDTKPSKELLEYLKAN